MPYTTNGPPVANSIHYFSITFADSCATFFAQPNLCENMRYLSGYLPKSVYSVNGVQISVCLLCGVGCRGGK